MVHTTKQCLQNHFMQRDAMHKRGGPVPSCGVHLSVYLPVMFVYSVEMTRHILKFFHHRVSTPFWFFHTTRYGNIPMGPG